MTITSNELEALLAEHPQYPEAYKLLNRGPQYLNDPKSSVVGLRSSLSRQVEIMARNASKPVDHVREQFRTMKFDAPAGNDVAGTVLAALGITGGAAAELLNHPNPHKYAAPIDALTRALNVLQDEDTRVSVNSSRGTATVIVKELVNGSFEDAITITMAQVGEFTTVNVGKMQLKVTVGKAANFGQTLMTMGKHVSGDRRMNMIEALENLINNASSKLGQMSGNVFNQAEGLALKFKVWQLLDDAAKPHEDQHKMHEDRRLQAARAAEELKARKEAATKCPCCGVAYSADAIKASTCSACGFPIPAISLQLMK